MLLLLRRIVSLTLGLVPLFLIWAGLRSLLFPNPPPDPTLYSVRGQNLQPINPLLFFGGGVVGLFGCYRMCRADGGWKWVLVLMAVFVYALILPVMQNGIHGPPGQGHHSARPGNLGIWHIRRLGLPVSRESLHAMLPRNSPNRPCLFRKVKRFRM